MIRLRQPMLILATVPIYIFIRCGIVFRRSICIIIGTYNIMHTYYLYVYSKLECLTPFFSPNL